MPPNQGLVHPQEYDIEDSNVELIGSDIDHKVKYNSALTEPAWNDGKIGNTTGLFIWRIESFEVVPWPAEKYGKFHTGDSYIILNSIRVSQDSESEEKLFHDIFFWLGSETTQDEAGTAAYKTVELDEFLHGAATQHREVEREPSGEFLQLFPRLTILRGGVRSGFRHVEEEEEKEVIITLLRVFKASSGGIDSTVVHEVEPKWQSLDDGDVFILDHGDKIWVWQGRKCSPMEKAKAAQVVHDMTLAKHVPVEVLAQEEPRSRRVVDLLGGKDVSATSFSAPRPVSASGNQEPELNVDRKLFRISDSSGTLTFELVNEGSSINRSDLDGSDVFLLDTGRSIWVWQGLSASRTERATWLDVAQAYARNVRAAAISAQPIAKVAEGNESPAFWKAVSAA